MTSDMTLGDVLSHLQGLPLDTLVFCNASNRAYGKLDTSHWAHGISEVHYLPDKKAVVLVRSGIE